MKTGKAKKSAAILLIVLAAVSSTGCATHDRRDTAYDPKLSKGQTLFDQMPNWDNAAEKICCGHLRQCKANQSPRC
jgi:hypothetical protein